MERVQERKKKRQLDQGSTTERNGKPGGESAINPKRKTSPAPKPGSTNQNMRLKAQRQKHTNGAASFGGNASIDPHERAATGQLAQAASTSTDTDSSKKRISIGNTLVADANWKRLKQVLPPPKQTRKTSASVTVATTVTSTTVVSLNGTTSSSPRVQQTTVSTGLLVHSKTASKVLALDCEMVGDEHRRSMLARVCIVEEDGGVLYDTFVRPTERVRDYRTRFSGIQPHHLTSSRAVPFLEAQQRVANIIRGCIVVGHGLKNDFEALKIEHPKYLIRDTSHYHRFKSENGQPRKLKHLVLERLNYVIQEGKKGHDPSVDARAALDLYLKHREEWEAALSHKKLRRSKL